jgi:non-homologous end joining protein Ku
MHVSRPNCAWRGAIEFAGFPVNVALYSRVKKQRNESFRNLAPSGQPVESRTFDPVTGEQFDKALIRKGVAVGKDEYAVMTPDALEQIKSGVKTSVAKPAQFVARTDLDLALAIDRYVVRPDDKVAGSESSVNIVWNGLRKTALAYVSQVSLGGGHDAILALYVKDGEFRAALLPFAEELYDVPEHEFVENDDAADLFEQVLDQQHDVESFEHARFSSEYRARRKAAIDAVIAGEEPVAVDRPEPKPDVPDLMAVLKATAAAKKKPKTTKTKELVA